MSTKTMVLKDEERQHSIPSEWRQTLSQIVEAFKAGEFQLRGITDVRPLSPEDAARVARNIERYGVHLTSLPESTWETSVCQWMRGYWDALIDLYTIEEGASDLILSVRVREALHGYDFQVESVHVP